MIIKTNASKLVHLVESGKFLRHKNYCKKEIQNQLAQVFKKFNVNAATLSSTHLPFLRQMLEESFPCVKFLDPADKVATRVMDKINSLSFSHSKHMPKKVTVSLGIYTTAENYQKSTLENNLVRLGVRRRPKYVSISKNAAPLTRGTKRSTRK